MNLKGVKLTWLGHATFRIETPGGKTVVIDPWVMNNPACPESEKKLKKVDVLLCNSTTASWWAFQSWRGGWERKAPKTWPR
jgi:hypothetical protein